MNTNKPIKTIFAVAGVLAIPDSGVAHTARERLFVDGVELLPGPSLAVRNHSPSGFAWGYSGSGAAQTALAICLHIFQSPVVAQRVYQDFKSTFVSRWPLASPFNESIDISDFLLDHWSVIEPAQSFLQRQPDS